MCQELQNQVGKEGLVMSLSDPLGDMLARIKNGQLRKKIPF